MNEDKDDVCPMEKLALQIADNYQFFLEIQAKFS